MPEPFEDYESGTIATVTGWGVLGLNLTRAETLHAVDIPLISDEECDELLTQSDDYGYLEIFDSFLCANDPQGNGPCVVSA